MCILCNKEQFHKACKEYHTRKRKQEYLVKCETFNAANTCMIKAAAKQKNLEILMKITDVDHIAKEAKYLRSCYIK